jgi:hypothetical protein
MKESWGDEMRLKGRVALHRWLQLGVVAVLLVSVLVSVPSVHSASNDDATAAVAEADSAMRVAFVSVLDAERNGANVSELMGRLNAASFTLTSAEASLRAGNYLDAVNHAGTCKVLSDAVAGDASVLKSKVNAAWWPTVSYGVLGGYLVAVVFLTILLLTWHWFRRFYAKKLLNSRPKVNE